jgi:hypothetical protein
MKMQRALIMHFLVIILANDSITTINIGFFKAKIKSSKTKLSLEMSFFAS